MVNIIWNVELLYCMIVVFAVLSVLIVSHLSK